MRRFLKRLTIASSVSLVLYLVVLAAAINHLSEGLPDLAELERIRPKLTSVVYSTDGRVLKTFSIQKRVLIPYEDMPSSLIDALLSKEDRTFWDHWGVNLLGIGRATIDGIMRGRSPQATSTITQQLARDLFLTKEHTLLRKAREAILAVRIERTYTKKEILQMYLNQVFWGGGSYGVQAAARSYFDKDAKDLNPQECATLIGLLPAPNKYNPLRFPARAQHQRNVVLNTMKANGVLSWIEADRLKAMPLATSPEKVELGIAPYFTEYIRLSLTEMLAKDDSLRISFNRSLGIPLKTGPDALIYEGGLSIETTLDSRLQAIAEHVLGEETDILQEYYDNEIRIRPDSAFAWADTIWTPSGDTMAVDTVVAKRVQSALVAIDARTGAIRAMVGGRNFDKTKFNRAVQALRQPGSTFKPFVYAAALDNNYTPVSMILNQPTTIIDTVETKIHEWRPANYDHSVGPPMPLRRALRHSKNLPSIRLLNDIGPRLVVRYAHHMGITTYLPAVRSLVLGVGEVKLIELTSAYSVFANEGILVKPFAMSRISSRTGVELIPKRTSGTRSQALNRRTAFLMTSILEDVVRRGTGGRSRWMYKFYHHAGGKTGTTNDNGDAWFVGFTPQIVCGVWTGFDRRVSMARPHTGAGAALPTWARFMKAAHDTLNLPDVEFVMPEGVVKVEICEDSWKRATPYCPKHYTEYLFKESVVEKCDIHSLRGIRRTSAPRATVDPDEEEQPRHRF